MKLCRLHIGQRGKRILATCGSYGFVLRIALDSSSSFVSFHSRALDIKIRAKVKANFRDSHLMTGDFNCGFLFFYDAVNSENTL